MTGSATPVVRVRHGAVLELQLANPPYNGLTGPMLRDFVDALNAAQLDDEVRAVVTTSAAQVWCAGGDLGDLSGEGTDKDLSDLLHEATEETGRLALVEREADRLGAGRYVLAIDAFDKPLIAAVGG